MKNSWRDQKIAQMQEQYGEHYIKWRGYTWGNPYSFCNMYEYVMEGLKSLPENPPLFVRMAILTKLDECARLLDTVIKSHAPRRAS